MCGIVGFYNSSVAKSVIERRDLVTMTQTLIHRGPNADGIVFNRNWGMGFRRLKIIDLSDKANQPMVNESKSLSLVFNGEVYNYRALREQLRGHGYTFKTDSDTEVVLRAFEKWGRKCFSKFNGMFSVGIFDREKEELTLAVDRLGKKPLYYFIGDGQICFFSELKAIIALPNIRKTINDEAIDLYLQFGYIPEPATIFEDIKKLRAGHVLTFSRDRHRVEPYWEIPRVGSETGPDLRSDYQTYRERIKETVADSVRLRLNSDVPLGLFLSGGVDSSLITAVAASFSSTIRTFSVVFDEKELGTATPSRAVASHLSTDHTEIYADPEQFSDFLYDMPTVFDEPFCDDSLIPTYFICKAARQYATVALSGDGGDELFGGYTRYSQLQRLSKYLCLPDWIRQFAGTLISLAPGDRCYKIGDLLRYDGGVYGYLLWLSTIWKPGEARELRRGFGSGASCQNFDKYFDFANTTNLIEKQIAIDVKTFLKDDILVKVDRASMANSLEVRSPLLDYRLVELALQMPLRYKIGAQSSKILLRDLLSDYVPLGLVEKNKVGFNIPLATWLRGEWRDCVEDCLSEQRIKKRGLLNWNYAEKMKDAFYRHGYDFSRKIFSLVVFEIWLQRYESQISGA